MPISVEEALFKPRAIAIIGASNDPAKLSGRPLDYLLRLGYRGRIYPVNPMRTEVQGTRSYPSLRDVVGPIDLAIVVVPAPAVIRALADCAEMGVSTAIVFASGFSEIGDNGKQLQTEIERLAAATGLRVVGPNCIGSFSLPTAAFATFSSAFDEETAFPDDHIGLVSQSGAVGTFIFATMVSMGVGVRYYASTGNEADVNVGELLGGFANDADVEVLLGYLEDARRLESLAAAAADARRLKKPMILLKSGATAAGARAVRFHTGSDPGSDAEFTAMIERHGAIRVDSMEAAADAALAFRDGRRSTGCRLAIITSSGGAAALATDAAVRLGLEVNEPNEELRTALVAILPAFGSAANPIDLTGAVLTDPLLLGRVLQKVIADSQIDMILLVLGNADKGAKALVEGIHRGYLATSKPLAVAWAGGSGRPRRALLDRRVPTYAEPLRAIRALTLVAKFSLHGREAR